VEAAPSAANVRRVTNGVSIAICLSIAISALIALAVGSPFRGGLRRSIVMAGLDPAIHAHRLNDESDMFSFACKNNALRVALPFCGWKHEDGI
jgi:hypothetical protein